MTQTTIEARSSATEIDALRVRAMNAAALGKFEEACTTLQGILEHEAAPTLEVLSDLAAVAMSAGDVVNAIAIARHVVTESAEHDAARYTLATSLAAIGSNAEALEHFERLNNPRFRGATPELADLAAGESSRLRSLIGAPRPETHKYDFSHLVQPLDQTVGGPIQDDEALWLYATVRGMRVKRVLEIGGLSGYSARNFLRALSWDSDTAVYTVDLNPVESQAPNHYTLCKDVARLEPADVHGKPLDMVFFDCHVYDAQMDMFVRFVNMGLITDATVIALHDTNLHPEKTAPWSYAIRDTDGTCGYVHQDVERKMVNALRRDFGYDAFSLHTDVRRNDKTLPFRHGVTLMKKFVELKA